MESLSVIANSVKVDKRQFFFGFLLLKNDKDYRIYEKN